MAVPDLTKYAYVRYSEAAVEHLFAVASGLDSAVVGEAQVLGQVRRAYAAAEANRTVGRVLHELAQRALAVGKRVHTETGIDAAGASVVSVALGMADTKLRWSARHDRRRRRRGRDGRPVGSAPAPGGGRPGRRRQPVAAPRATARRKIRGSGAAARALGMDDLAAALADADVVVSCTGAVRPVVLACRRAPAWPPVVARNRPAAGDLRPRHAARRRPRRRRPARRLRGRHGPGAARAVGARRLADAEAARHLVAAEVATYLAGQRMAEVTPTVTALRQRAADVVEAELLRLDDRLPGLEAAHRDEVARTVRRVVDKLLHAPTVRVKQLASAPGGDSYAEALRELFELDPTAVDAVATAGELPAVPTDLAE